jgi:Ca2+-binding EF-hand superfamily protein
MDNELSAKNKNKEIINDYAQLTKVSNECSFSKVEIESIMKLFKKFDPHKTAYIYFHDILDMLHGLYRY